MRIKTLVFIYIFFFWCGTSEASSSLNLKSVPKAMDRLFKYHIENKKLTPIIIQRSLKIYLEYFDPDKKYVLQSEADPYLHISEAKANEVIERYQKGDFSDYIALNRMIQNAIVRSQTMRKEIANEIIENSDKATLKVKKTKGYAKSKEDLYLRQKNRMVLFLNYHQKRIPLDSSDRRARIFHLYEKKVQNYENTYLYLRPNGQGLPQTKAEYYLTLRVLKSLAKSLDAHTSFFSEEEAQHIRVNLEKQFSGIGVVLSEGIDGIFISDLVKGGPAELSGKVHVNDFIVSIDGQSLDGVSFEKVLDQLKKKDQIVLGLKRANSESSKDNPKTWRVSLRKTPIVMENDRLTYTTERYGDGVIGKMTLHTFYESGSGFDSASDMRKALREMQKKGPIHGLILDLRENSGGFLSQAVKVAGLFIKSGVVVISKYNGGEKHYLRKVDTTATYNGPLIVLTSQLSASAAEIVAQALQDYGAAIVLGDERTFGKGSIQFQTITDANADMFFKVTVGRYYTVSGKSTQIHGVKADIVVPTTFSAYNIGERFLEYPLPADQIDAAYTDNLSDLDMRTKFWFEKNYLPNLQKKIPFWRKMLPQLQKNSKHRISKNPNFQLFLQRQEIIRARQDGREPTRFIELDENYGVEDLQMQESTEVLKDMIYLEAESRKASKLSFSSSQKKQLHK